jgi:glycerol-3-phosphate dehydrogenase (NAD(P)+)
MKVGILGGGAWGQAVARLVMAAGHEPFIAYRADQGRERRLVKPPHILPSTPNPREVSDACELLIAAVSASELRSAVRLAAPGPSHRVVVAGRGLEPASGRWLTDVVLEECDAVRVGALAGPAPANEILNGSLCAGVIASPFAEVRALVTTALHSARYRVYESSDLRGVELAGAMVPVLATLIGVARTLPGAGVGMHALVLSRGLEEAARLAAASGSDPRTFGGLAGVGDLVAAQAVAGHPHFDAGAAIAAGRRDLGPEPVARALVAFAARHRVELPLTEALVAIYDGTPAVEAVLALMGRAPTRELTR